MTSNSSWADHKNGTVGDVTSLYDNFPFYSLLYGANPRVLVVGHQGFDDKPWAQEIRLASKSNETTEWVVGAFYKTEQTDIAENDFYPGYLDYFNACVPVYGAGSGVTPSQCGIGETAYTPGQPPNTINGIPIVKDQAYIGNFETKYTDLAGFGEYTWHFAPSLERHRRCSRIQADGVTEPADGPAVRRPRLHLQRGAKRNLAQGVMEGESRVSDR